MQRTITLNNRDTQQIVTALDPLGPVPAVNLGYGLKVVGDGTGTNATNAGIGFSKGTLLGQDFRAIVLSDNLDDWTGLPIGFFFSGNIGNNLFRLGLSNAGGANYGDLTFNDTGNVSLTADNQLSLSTNLANVSINSGTGTTNITGNQAAGPGVQVQNIGVGQAALRILSSVGTEFSDFFSGNGTPEGVVTADSSSLFFRADGAANNEHVYIKTTDGINTGWLGIPLSGGASLQWYAENATAPVTAPSAAANSSIVAIGDGAIVTGSAGSFAIGNGATASSALDSVVLGTSSAVIGVNNGIAIGNGAGVFGTSSISIGTGASDGGGPDSIIIGDGAIGSISGNEVIIGKGATGGAGAGATIAIGFQANTNSAGSDVAIAIGANSVSQFVASTALGYQANAGADDSIAIGSNSATTATNSIAIGANAKAFTQSISIGQGVGTNITTGTRNIGIGDAALFSVQDGGYNIAIGVSSGNNITNGSENVLIGDQTGTSMIGANYNTVVGSVAGSAITTGSTNTIIGQAAGQTLTTGIDNVIIGAGSVVPVAGSSNVVVGNSASSTADSAVVVGISASATGDRGVAIGIQATATDINTAALGYQSTAGGARSLAIGFNALTDDINSTAIGSSATTSGTQDSTALGTNAVVTANNTVILGDIVIAGVGIGRTDALAKLHVDTNGGANTVAIDQYTNVDGSTNTYQGLGSPEGVVTGNRGDIYKRIDGTGQIYQKTTDAANTGWLALSTGGASKYYEQATYAAGANTITHNLNLTTPEALILMMVDTTTNAVVIPDISNYTANSVDVTFALATNLLNTTIIV